MATLPADFKQRVPSMRALYDVLSADIHGAIDSVDVFERATKEIEALRGAEAVRH